MTDRKALNDPNEPPEDVAMLYSWANLHGAKYRDFSASRAQLRERAKQRAQQAEEEAREQARQAAEAQRAEEARRAAEAALAEERVRQAEIAAQQARQAEIAAQQAAQHAAQLAAQQAAQLAAQQAEMAAQQAAQEAAQRAAQQAAQEMARRAAEQAAQEARAAEMQAAQHAEAARAAQQAAQQAAWQQPAGERNTPSAPYPPAPRYTPPQGVPYTPAQGGPYTPPAPPYAPPQAAPAPQTPAAPQAPPAYYAPPQPQYPQYQAPPAYRPAVPTPQPPAPEPPVSREVAAPPPSRSPWASPEQRELPLRPAWLADRPHAATPVSTPHAPDDTIQGSRDRLTSRWFALRGVFEGSASAVETAPAPSTAHAPALAVFSLAGGVGKTSMVATLGRALSSRGERVLLVDTAAFGLLPFFFGARDQRPGQLRTFSPPAASGDAPIQMIAIDPEGLAPENGQEPLTAEIQKISRGVSRVIVDLATASGATTRRILRLGPLVLVPVIPDMNSVVSVASIDAFFEHNNNVAGKILPPYYVLNQFDASLPLHLDVREVLREQLGERLLPFSLRRAPAVSEALAEGMTVMDYAPNSTVAEDFASLAGWIKNQSAPASGGFRGVRWSER